MQLLLFLIISAFIHGLFLALPFPRPSSGGGQAIPVTLVLGTRWVSEQATALPATRHRQPVKLTPAKERPVSVNKTDPPPRAKKRHHGVAAKGPLPTPAREVERAPSRKVEPPKETPEPVRIAAGSIGVPLATHDEATAPRDESYPRQADAVREEEPPYKAPPPDLITEAEDLDPLSGPELPVNGPPAAGDGALREPEQKKLAAAVAQNAIYVPADYASIARPEYPRRARRMGWQGTTLLRVLVDSEGMSRVVEISTSSGYAVLDQAAAKAVKKWRFRPARSGNAPVESWVKVPVVFDLKEIGETSLLVDR